MKRYKNFLLLLYLITLIFGCQSDDQAGSVLSETAVPITRAAASETPILTSTDPPIQPTDQPPTLTATPQPTNTPPPTPTPTATPVNWAAVQNGATILYYHDKDLWRTNIDGSVQEPLTEGDMLAAWDLESNEDKWYSGGTMPRPFVSPNGRFIAFTLTGRGVIVVDVSNPFPPRTLASGSVLMAWSPDSRHLAYGRTTLNLYDTQTNRAMNLTNTISRGVHNITWSSDGRFIALACCFSPPDGEYEGVEYGEIRQFDMETGLIETTGEAALSIGGGASTLCWQDTGDFVPYQEAEQTNHCTPTGSISLPGSQSPDKQLIAWMLFSSEEDPLHNHQLTVSNYETDEIIWQIILEEAANRIAWTADGRYLLLNNYYPGLSPIWRLAADGLSQPKVVIEEGFLFDAIPMWQE